MAYRTLDSLRATLLARLGMAGMGASGGANQAIFDSFLSNGQSQLYWMQDWKKLVWYEEKTLGVGQNQLDYPRDCELNNRILKIETVYNGQWRELSEGIRTEDWNTMDTPSFPYRYERYAQILIYPKADQVYTVRIWYVKDLGRFSENGDRATLDDEMVFLHALANAKAHYRHPDAQTYQGQLNTMLGAIRGQSLSFNGVYRRDQVAPAAQRPHVEGRDT
ncbi:phage adaptor protein [Herminiimonas contaminans]|uniref:Uncharacterized protein n=1 Tax=Herminiimonas contaminans TaxID=1111140 RepID=A0ABS0ERA1_9BURK|nr:hypothetical protein [Herminiimonas contaminans]MBF8177245.1 hypothetical protein [Herminiimonas contaminans]